MSRHSRKMRAMVRAGQVLVLCVLAALLSASCTTRPNGQGLCLKLGGDCNGDTSPTLDLCTLFGAPRGGNLYAFNADWQLMPYADAHRRAIAQLAAIPEAAQALVELLGVHVDIEVAPWECDWLTCDATLDGARAQALAALHVAEDPALEGAFVFPEIVNLDAASLAAAFVSVQSNIKSWQPPAICRKPPDDNPPADPPNKCSDFQEQCSNPNLLRAGIYPYCCPGLGCSAQSFEAGAEDDPREWYGTCCMTDASADEGYECTANADCCQLLPRFSGDGQQVQACQGGRCCQLAGSLCHRADDHCCAGFACTGDDPPNTDEDIGTCEPL